MYACNCNLSCNRRTLVCCCLVLLLLLQARHPMRRAPRATPDPSRRPCALPGVAVCCYRCCSLLLLVLAPQPLRHSGHGRQLQVPTATASADTSIADMLLPEHAGPQLHRTKVQPDCTSSSSCKR
jgi:hypothetical protein